MRNLSNFKYILIDLTVVEETDEKLIENLITIKTLYEARIILLAENEEVEVINKITETAKIYNIITSSTIEKIKEEVEICISPQGMDKRYLLKNINYNYNFEMELTSKYNFLKSNIKIIIAGSMVRAGTTTTSLNIASFLSSIGAKVSYTEANRNHHLREIHSYFFLGNPIKNNYFTQGGIDYFFRGNVPSDNYDFNILDLGVLGDKNSKIFKMGDIRLLCGGMKPYEMNEVKEIINTIDEDIDYNILNDPYEIKPMASYGDGKWEGSYGAYMHMTIYFERLVYNNVPCVKLLRATGGVNIQDSLMDVQRMEVELIQRSLVWPSTFNQRHSAVYLYNATFTRYPPTNWIPVPEHEGDTTHFGGKMKVTFVRGSRTWTDTLSVLFLEP